MNKLSYLEGFMHKQASMDYLQHALSKRSSRSGLDNEDYKEVLLANGFDFGEEEVPSSGGKKITSSGVKKIPNSKNQVRAKRKVKIGLGVDNSNKGVMDQANLIADIEDSANRDKGNFFSNNKTASGAIIAALVAALVAKQQGLLSPDKLSGKLV